MIIARNAISKPFRVTSTRGFVTRPIPRPKDPLLTATNATVTQITPEITFIHRPPPSAPSPLSYTTAPTSPLLRSPSSGPSSPGPLPPLLRPGSEQVPVYHLSKEQIDEIRRLRSTNPKKYSVVNLAEKYQCSRLFVSMVAPLSSEAREKKEAQLEKQSSRWGEAKRMNREIRKKRRSMW